MSDSLPLRFRFGLRFSLLARQWRRHIDGQLALAGLTDATWVPLVHLQETGGGVTQKELALRVGVEGSSLVRVLDILEREGLIRRRRNQKDGRARLVDLTPAGEARLALIRQELSRAEADLLADLTDAEIAVMLQQLERIEYRIAAAQAPEAATDTGTEAGDED